MAIGFNFLNVDGTPIVNQDDVQLVCIGKVTGSTTVRSNWSVNIVSFDTSVVPNSALLYAIVSDQPIIINPFQRDAGKLTVISPKNVTANFTIYLFDRVSKGIGYNKESGNTGLEIYDEDGNVVFSTSYKNMKIAVTGTITTATNSATLPSGYALCVPQLPFDTFYTGTIWNPEGAVVNWNRRGYSYNKVTGAMTSQYITEVSTNEFTYPAQTTQNYYVPYLMVDVSNL